MMWMCGYSYDDMKEHVRMTAATNQPEPDDDDDEDVHGGGDVANI
jgi:hypothetical protein